MAEVINSIPLLQPRQTGGGTLHSSERSLAPGAVFRLVCTTFALPNSPLCSPPSPNTRRGEIESLGGEARVARGMCADASPQGLPDARRRGRFSRKIYKAGERGRLLAEQELSQTHGETLPRIKGNMTFEKNVRVCLWCGGGRGWRGGQQELGPARGLYPAFLASASHLPLPLLPLWRTLVAGPRVFLSLPPCTSLLPLFPRRSWKGSVT